MKKSSPSSCDAALSPYLKWSLATVLVTISLGWVVTRNPQQSLLLGLLALPANYVGDRIKSAQIKQRQQKTQSSFAKAIQGMEMRLMDLEKYEEQIYQVIGSAKNFNHRLESENQNLRTERFFLSEQISSLQKKRYELIQDCAGLNPQKKQLETQLKYLYQQIETANNQKLVIEKECLERSHDLKIVENSCAFIRQELDQLHQELLEKREYKQDLHRTTGILERKVKSSTLQSQTLIQQEQELQTKLIYLKDQENILTESYQTLQQRLDSLRQEEMDLTLKIQEKREEVASLEGCLKHLFDEYHNLQNDICEEQSHLAILNEKPIS